MAMLPNYAATNTLPLVVLALASGAVADANPKAATWHDTPIGPDGPWNAVEVKLGTLGQTVALFPGRNYQSYVITSDYCAYNASISHCGAGTYSKDEAIQKNLAGIQYKPDAQDFLAGAEVKGNKTSMFIDTIDLGCEDCVIANTTLSLLESQMIAYPGGVWYPIFAGCLSVGAEAVNQTYTQDDAPAINASVIPWYLSRHRSTPSSSFGMHVGSAVSSSAMTGSLLYGGYDRNRVVGDVLGMDGVFTDAILLKDVGIRVVRGVSPFAFESKDGLLAGGNISLSSGVSVRMDACSPYLTLPRSTCDSIAANLPVHYNASLGLYIWNTEDPKYDQIVRSASALTFTLSSANKELTVNVPFHHLNLTLVSPLSHKPTPYFPCSTGGTGSYVLGRAFFQDVFMGANWERKRWWLAQAPGPKFQAGSNVVSILKGDTNIYSGGSDWASSWDGVWTELKAPGPNNSTGSNGTVSNGPGAAPPSSGLSTGAKVGIGAGAGVGVIICACAAVFLWRRKSQRARQTEVAQGQNAQNGPYPNDDVKVAGMLQPHAPAEVVGTTAKGPWDGFDFELAGDERHPGSRTNRKPSPYSGELQELP
ncbi:hypothetical protein PLIIFM63780_003164 [Purpureocillium lilacinum]|uniref:Peptidase A1 domain-containing protein n=1 Tax=Purpureocillium lilacinum TaxID=33203 RepID=A0ABR0CE51_PURLI|nr:hypothetical protein Purlil1_1184 [Purpureocillium lilacinum]GJN79647.1 hypothetical protein PLIIFM63780_003164 [Purpureocillium lilacinum]